MPRKYPSPGTHCGTGYAARSLVPGRDGGEDAVEDRSQEGRKHIFAINASPEFLNIVRELFQDEGYNVTTTNFAPNSFAQIEALQPDALIIDIAIGQEAGWELLDQLGADADTAGIPVLVVSTDPRLLTRAQEQAARYGMHRYLEKPFDIDALLTNIQEMVGAA
jgi:CheY-like chemotaxis protein